MNLARSEDFSPPHLKATTEIVITNLDLGGTYHV